jgi:hypothetical protein
VAALLVLMTASDGSSTASTIDQASRPSPTAQLAYGLQFADGRGWLEHANLNGTNKRFVTHPPRRGVSRNDSGPAWSPDGRTLTFFRETPAKLEVFVAGRAAGRPRRVASFRGASALGAELAWAANGKAVAIVSAHCIRNLAISLVDPHTSRRRDLQRLHSHPDRYGTLYSVAWSPNGQKLAYVAGEWGTAPECRRDPSTEVYTINRDGTGKRLLATPTKGGIGGVTWLSNSTLAFTDCFDVTCDVLTINADGTGQTAVARNQELTNEGANLLGLSNGEVLVAGKRRVVAVGRGRVREVARNPRPQWPLRLAGWTLNRRLVAFTSGDPQVLLLAYPAGGRRPRVISIARPRRGSVHTPLSVYLPSAR